MLKIAHLHQLTQEVITALGNKQPLLAKEKINEANTLLGHLIDSTLSDKELIELSKYEALIKLLNNKLK